jgi:hypothetical protein
MRCTAAHHLAAASPRRAAHQRSAEAAWFASHPEYADVLHQCGVGNLAKRINIILGA